MKSLFLSSILFLMLPLAGIAQSGLSALEEEAYFDFWIGTWELTWEAPDGSIEKGTNNIEKILDGNVILENFEAESGRFAGYKGKSFSVFDQRTSSWKQTWVDSNRGYIDLDGKFDGNKRMFITETTGPDGKKQLRRMVFYDITEDSFTWDWEASSDGGETWQLSWRIRYQRK